MPWALFNRPSIQLGTLKAYIESRTPYISVETSHPYLEIAAILGPELYYWISQSPWVSEAIYSPLVFPEQASEAEALALKYARKADPGIRSAFHYKTLFRTVEKHLTNWCSNSNWSQYSLVGFSVCFHQLCASLAAAKAIKNKYPQVAIVFGGSSCAGAAGKSLLETFHFIDYIIPGEGERDLLALTGYLAAPQKGGPPGHVIAGKNGRNNVPQMNKRTDDKQIATLSDLPVPDYADYFIEQKKLFAHKPFIPVLPLEFSRGCWWNKCSFCNLNLQWCGYRYKKAAQVMHEAKTYVSRHKCLDFTFTDNMLPPQEALKFFGISGSESLDLQFFAEVRSTNDKKSPQDIFSVYKHGGLTTIQVGIEAFSSSLLQKMQKGVSVIENIATMRNAQENNIRLEGNLILRFPGSTEIEAAETLTALDFVFPYPPLTAASFFLGYDSPVHKDPRKFGIKAVVNHPNNYKLFPGPILSRLDLLIKDYQGDKEKQRKIWKPVLQKIKQWQRYHAARKQDALTSPLLYYRDGGDFLLIRQELPDGGILRHRLEGTSRSIYLACTNIVSDNELFKQFPHVSSEKILVFLKDLQKKKILFSEKNKYLALAVHFRD